MIYISNHVSSFLKVLVKCIWITTAQLGNLTSINYKQCAFISEKLHFFVGSAVCSFNSIWVLLLKLLSNMPRVIIILISFLSHCYMLKLLVLCCDSSLSLSVIEVMQIYMHSCHALPVLKQSQFPFSCTPDTYI